MRYDRDIAEWVQIGKESLWWREKVVKMVGSGRLV
jgi:hypothetical protein